jgi:NitT/TauT family transport system substrate-binding protein
MIMSKISRSGFLAGTAGATAAAVVATRRPAQAATAVAVAASPADDLTPVVYALQSGLFERNGLDVHLDKLTSGSAVAAAVASGTYAIGKSSLTGLLIARDKGVPFTLIAPAAIYDSATAVGGMIVANDSAVRTGHDFENQVAAVAAFGDIGQLSLQAWIAQHNGNPAAVKFIEVPNAAALAAVQEHRVIAAEAADPFLTAALTTHTVYQLKTYSAVASRFAITAWFTTQPYADQHSDVVRAFARSVAAASTYTNAHHDATASLMAAYTGQDLGLLEHMTRTLTGVTLEPALIQPVIDACFAYKLIAHPLTASEVIAR